MRKSGQTKERILQKAIEIVGEKGYASTTTREIAEAAGVSEATLFKYYRTKQELLEQIVVCTIDKFYDYTINKALPAIFAECEGKPTSFLLRQIMKERLRFFQEHAPEMRVVFQEMMIDSSVRELFKQKVWETMKEISDRVFDRGKRSGEIREVNNQYLRKALFGILFFMIFEQALGLDEPAACSPEEEVDKLLDILFHGIMGE